jgi:hypothetical protein
MQEFTVFVIVGLAACYAAWKLMPRAARGRLAQATVGWAQRRGRLSDRDAAALASRLAEGGCGTCKDCGSCGSAANSVSATDTAVLRFERRTKANGAFDTFL